MNKNKRLSLLTALTIAIAILALGCTEEQPAKTVLKYQVINKSMITANGESMSAEYIYVPSVVDSPRSVSATRPHWQGSAKVVRLKWSENAMVVYEIEKDSRFNDNITNQKPIMRIPVEHLDYKCSEDAYGDCTSQEEENGDVTWDKKKFFRPNFEEIKIQELNVLPIALDNLFGNCYAELGSEFVDYKIEKQAINFTVEKTFKHTSNCLNFSSLSDASFNVRYHYSFLRLDKATSKDYVAVDYPSEDHGVFGFFETEKIQLDPDNNTSVGSESHFMNRWNPNQKVTYYLNAAFNKPQYKTVKEATYRAFDAVNSALSSAGTKLRFELKDPVKGMQPGDLRNNMIVMVEDPQATGIIGYGPSVANPFTGEIVQGKTVMYLGSIKKYVKSTYDELVEEKQAKLKAEEMLKSIGTKPSDVILADHLLPQTGGTSSAADSSSEIESQIQASLGSFGNGSANSNNIFAPTLSKDVLRERATNPLNYNELTSDLRQRMEVLSRHNAFPADLIDFHNVLERSVDDIVEHVGLKPWQDLSNSQKEMVLSKLVPYIWLPTLVHELGHNLGLRHNFAGSEDVANFYTDRELAEMGTTTPFKYSSVMDYSYRTSNELRVMGKYDIAALRFGYSRSVELTDGSYLEWDKFKASATAERKPFDFCTDEHVGANPNCNRFDEGSNLLEITQNLIAAYKRRYGRANLRNGRHSFSLMDDYRQMSYVSNMFMNLRMVYERYEGIKNDFNLEFDDKVWEEIDFLNELKQSMLLTAEFFIEVLKTPNITCAISAAENPFSIQAIMPLKDISSRAVSCFDPILDIPKEFVIIGQAGKSFQSLKASDNPNAYVDQIDVRGIWIDKLLAAKFLLTRAHGTRTFDKYTENYLHVPGVRVDITLTLNDILLDKVHGPMEFQTIFGFPFTLPDFSYSLADQHEIRNPMVRQVGKRLNLPGEATPFHQELLSAISNFVPSKVHNSKPFISMFSVNEGIPHTASRDDYLFVKVGSEEFYAETLNLVAVEMITMIDLLSLDREKLAAALTEVTKPGGKPRIKPGSNKRKPSTAEMEAVIKYGEKKVERFLEDENPQSTDYYISTLRRMTQL